MGSLRIAQAQINTTVGDIGANCAKIASSIEHARKSRADIVTFPELTVSGYPPEDLVLKPHFVQDCREALDEIAHTTAGVTALVGLPVRDGDAVYNAAALLSDGKIVSIYHKIELPNYGVFDEKRNFAPGTTPLIFTIDDIGVLITICEDIWIVDNQIERCARDNRVALTLNISGSPYYAGKISVQQEIAAGFARRTGSYLTYTNLVGGQDELVFNGTSLVVDPAGRLVARAALFQEDLLITDIEIDPAQTQTRRPVSTQECGEVPVVHRLTGDGRKKITPRITPVPGRVDEIYRALVVGTADYVKKNGFKKVVMGLSGGIDSSLVAAIAVDALGTENVVGVTMPSPYTSMRPFRTRSAWPIISASRSSPSRSKRFFPPISRCSPGSLATGKRASGPRTCRPASGATSSWRSPTGTGGWCSRPATRARRPSVIRPSTETRPAALPSSRMFPRRSSTSCRNISTRRQERRSSPASVIVRPPTAELRPNQKDEDSLPPYAVLDPILHNYVEDDKDVEEIVALGFDEKRVLEVARLVDINEYKRRQSPPASRSRPRHSAATAGSPSRTGICHS